MTVADGDIEGASFVLHEMMATGMPAMETMRSDILFIFGDLVPERDSKASADGLELYA